MTSQNMEKCKICGCNNINHQGKRILIILRAV